MKIKTSTLIVMVLLFGKIQAQDILTLENVFQQIQKENPSLKMFDAQIRSQDEAAKGVRNWDAPEIGAGLWMTPYNTRYWKADETTGATGMGQFMISAQQMFPNTRKQHAEAKYMEAISSVDKEKKKASLNEFYALAKKNYYEWVIIKKKLRRINQNENLLNFMIKNAEIRYKNGQEKLSAYYKAKAASGNLQNMRLTLENQIKQKQVALSTLMNHDKRITFDIDTTYQIKNYSISLIDTASVISERSDIRAVEKDIQVTLLQQEMEKAKLKPEFGVVYNHMFGFGGLPSQYTLMGTIKLPMAKWASKTVKSNAESLKWKSEALVQQKRMLVNDITGMAYDMKNEIDLKQKQIKLFENNIIPALKKNYQIMQLGYEQNTEQLFTLYDAWETLNMTQLDYLDQLQQLLIMQVELERILEVKL